MIVHAFAQFLCYSISILLNLTDIKKKILRTSWLWLLGQIEDRQKCIERHRDGSIAASRKLMRPCNERWQAPFKSPAGLPNSLCSLRETQKLALQRPIDSKFAIAFEMLDLSGEIILLYFVLKWIMTPLPLTPLH